MYEYFVSTPIDQQRDYAFEAEHTQHMQYVLQGKVQNRKKWVSTLIQSVEALTSYFCICNSVRTLFTDGDLLFSLKFRKSMAPPFVCFFQCSYIDLCSIDYCFFQAWRYDVSAPFLHTGTNWYLKVACCPTVIYTLQGCYSETGLHIVMDRNFVCSWRSHNCNWYLPFCADLLIYEINY